MTERDVTEALEGAELIPAVQAPLQDAKRLLASCLDADIPAVLGRTPSCPTGGCTPKIELFVRPDDIPRLAALMREQWQDLVEGTLGVAMRAVEVGEDEHLPCPACGTAAPLVDGACSDCGLHLE